jgi:DNA invertase Pin-like site-specific DNA recombinase
VKFGRKPKLTPQQIARAQKILDAGERREDVAGIIKVNRSTLYRALSRTP